MREKGIASPSARDDELQFEASLRPARLEEFTGQTKLKENLAIAIEAARQRGDAMDHVLLYGPPGLGKTTLATIISNELGVGFEQTSGPILQKKLDLTGHPEQYPRAARFSSSTKSTGCCPTWKRCSMPPSRIFGWTSSSAPARERARTLCPCRASRPSAPPPGRVW